MNCRVTFFVKFHFAIQALKVSFCCNVGKKKNSGTAFQGGKTLCSQAMENMFIKYVEYQKKKEKKKTTMIVLGCNPEANTSASC